MRHIMRRAIQLIGVILLLPLWFAGDADAVFEAALRGDYDMTLTRTCSSDVTNGTPSFVLGPFGLRGTATFDGIGGGSFSGETLNMPIQAITVPSGTGIDVGGGREIIVNRASETCTLTYTVNADGSFTGTMNCNLTFLLGGPAPAPGQTATLNGIKLNGKIALDGTNLVLGSTEANSTTPETFTVTSGTGSGTSQKRICNGTGVATSRR